MISHTLHLTLPDSSCPVFIGKNLFASDIIAKLCKHRILIVTQPTIANLYLEPLLKSLSARSVDVCVLEEGEENKTLAQWQKILEMLIQRHHDRHSTLLALGGGVVGDITGFAAACFMRGISFVQIPTTLIAQVDAAIGGKTAVNFLTGKNLLGAFHQPLGVVSDVTVLKTLPGREYFSGLAEVVKYGLIYSADFFVWLENNISGLLNREENILIETIHQSAKIKCDFVMQDEKETGVRSLLNFGHTFGHALESVTNYQTYLHGEAVAIGMVLAARLSCELDWISQHDVTRMEKLLTRLNLFNEDLTLPTDASILIEHMQHDKKNQHQKINLILLKRIGEAVKTSEVSLEEIESFMKNFSVSTKPPAISV